MNDNAKRALELANSVWEHLEKTVAPNPQDAMNYALLLILVSISEQLEEIRESILDRKESE